MELKHLNGLLEDLDQEDCMEIDGGGPVKVIVGIVVGVIVVGCATTPVQAPSPNPGC